MRVTYSGLPGRRSHPLGRTAVLKLLEAIRKDIGEAPSHVHFGWNGTTTQEGRVVQRQSAYEIRINFTVEEGRSRMIRQDKRWLEAVAKCGGVPDHHAGQVLWPGEAAERYCSFLVLHEAAHIAYARLKSNGKLEGYRSSATEEQFCDAWALERVQS